MCGFARAQPQPVVVVWSLVRLIIRMWRRLAAGLILLALVGCVPIAGSVGATASAPQAVTQTAVGTGNVVTPPGASGFTAWWNGPGPALTGAAVAVGGVLLWAGFRAKRVRESPPAAT